jgi:methyl-accepting chemotaxis protein
MLVAQASGAVLADRLEAIMWAQVTMAVVMVLCVLAILAAAFAVWLLARKAMKEVEKTRDLLIPHVTPVLSRAGSIADDVRAITAGFKEDADGVHEVIRDVLERSRRATDSLEERVRRFGLVLEAVQEQAEALMLDAASTAHGVHAAARALREERPRVPRPADRGAEGSKPTERESQ